MISSDTFMPDVMLLLAKVFFDALGINIKNNQINKTMTDKELLELLARTNKTRTMRKCAYTNKLEVVGSDGMTRAERKNHEEIKKQWISAHRTNPILTNNTINII